MKKLLTASLAVIGLGVSGLASADSFANVYTCKLKDGVELDAVQEANSKWLKFVNSKVKGGGITSAIGTAVVYWFFGISMMSSALRSRGCSGREVIAFVLRSLAPTLWMAGEFCWFGAHGR